MLTCPGKQCRGRMASAGSQSPGSHSPHCTMVPHWEAAFSKIINSVVWKYYQSMVKVPSKSAEREASLLLWMVPEHCTKASTASTGHSKELGSIATTSSSQCPPDGCHPSVASAISIPRTEPVASSEMLLPADDHHENGHPVSYQIRPPCCRETLRNMT